MRRCIATRRSEYEQRRRRADSVARRHLWRLIDVDGDDFVGELATLDGVVQGDGATADALLARAEEHVRLRACVDRLCKTQRAVVTLRMLEAQPGEDVATALHLTRGHVDVLLHRAKASLAVCMME